MPARCTARVVPLGPPPFDGDICCDCRNLPIIKTANHHVVVVVVVIVGIVVIIIVVVVVLVGVYGMGLGGLIGASQCRVIVENGLDLTSIC